MITAHTNEAERRNTNESATNQNKQRPSGAHRSCEEITKKVLMALIHWR